MTKPWTFSPSLDNRVLIGLALFLSVLPLWQTRYLPFVDVAQHAAQVTALRAVADGQPAFVELFEINWLTPYWLGYLLLFLLSLVVPILVAVKLLLSLVIVSTALCCGLLLRAVGSDERFIWLAVPSSYSFALYWGMVNFVVAVPFGLLFLVLTVHFNRHASLTSGLLVALASLALFFCHVMVVGLTSVIAIAYLVGANHRNAKALALRCIPYLTPLPLIVIWWKVWGTNEATQHPIDFGYGLDRLTILFSHLSGFDYWHSPIALITAGAVISSPFVLKARFDRRPQRWLPFLAGLITCLAFPSSLSGIALLGERLGAFLCPLWLTMWNGPLRSSSRWRWLPLIALLLWTSANVVRFDWFNAETRGLDRVLSVAQPEKRMLSMPVQNRRRHFARPAYLHLPLWYQATRSGVVDFNAASFPNVVVRYRSHERPSIPQGFEWQPSTFRWEEHRGDRYDYFLVCSDRDLSEELFKDRRGLVTLRARNGWWWLYEKSTPD
jgi:hypothetical protein